ncbi:hypothetical protein Tco_1228944 [Tanacetum coccineum]
MLAIPHLSQVSSMAEIDSKEALKKSMAGIRALKSLTKETQERRAEDLALSINRRLWVFGLSMKMGQNKRGQFLEIAPMTVEEVNTRVIELAELHEHDTQDLYALLEDAQDRDSMNGRGGGLCFPRGLGSLDRIESGDPSGASDPP